MPKRSRTIGTDELAELKQAISEFQAEFGGLADEVKDLSPDVFEEFARFRDSMERQDRCEEALDTILAILDPGPERA